MAMQDGNGLVQKALGQEGMQNNQSPIEQPKFKGVKKSITDAIRTPNYFRIYGNPKTGEVWANSYESDQSWDEYHDPDIVQLISGYGINERGRRGVAKPTMKQLLEAIQEKTQNQPAQPVQFGNDLRPINR